MLITDCRRIERLDAECKEAFSLSIEFADGLAQMSTSGCDFCLKPAYKLFDAGRAQFPPQLHPRPHCEFTHRSPFLRLSRRCENRAFRRNVTTVVRPSTGCFGSAPFRNALTGLAGSLHVGKCKPPRALAELHSVLPVSLVPPPLPPACRSCLPAVPAHTHRRFTSDFPLTARRLSFLFSSIAEGKRTPRHRHFGFASVPRIQSPRRRKAAASLTPSAIAAEAPPQPFPDTKRTTRQPI